MLRCREPPVWRLSHCKKRHHYSMTSSALVSSASGTVRPSALAVLRLMTSSSFVACCTGSRPAFPL
jgi:hypothetical protein